MLLLVVVTFVLGLGHYCVVFDSCGFLGRCCDVLVVTMVVWVVAVVFSWLLWSKT